MLLTNNRQDCIPLRLHPSGFVESFLSFGAKKRWLLRDAALSEADLEDSAKKINLDQQHALILSGLKQCPGIPLGLKVGLGFPWSFYGELAPIIESSPTLKEAGAAFRRYTAIAQPNHKAFLANINYYLEQTDLLVVPIGSPYPQWVQPELYQFDLDFRLAITLRLFDACGCKDDAYTGITLRLKRPPPRGANPYSQLPATHIRYNSKDNAITANHTFFTKAWRPLRRHTFKHALAKCEAAYQEAGLCESLEDCVRWHIDMSFNRNITIEQVANALGLNERSLSRKLAAQGTSFRQIVYQSRMNLAMHHIRFSMMRSEEIAEVLGFSCKSSLMRSIKNWSGLTYNQIQQSYP